MSSYLKAKDWDSQGVRALIDLRNSQSVSVLGIDTGKKTGLERSKRICLYCNENLIEDDFHLQ